MLNPFTQFLSQKQQITIALAGVGMSSLLSLPAIAQTPNPPAPPAPSPEEQSQPQPPVLPENTPVQTRPRSPVQPGRAILPDPPSPNRRINFEMQNRGLDWRTRDSRSVLTPRPNNQIISPGIMNTPESSIIIPHRGLRTPMNPSGI